MAFLSSPTIAWCDPTGGAFYSFLLDKTLEHVHIQHSCSTGDDTHSLRGD